MFIFGKIVDQLDPQDIKRLVENQIQETKSLDYKKELKLSQDKEKKEFLFDITSMYNSDGGSLIYGIEEKKDENGKNTGIPENIVGITIDNLDKLFQQIEDILKANTEPSVSIIGLKHLKVDEKDILVIGINKGLGLPSMVTFNETNKFYRRRNSGKYAVDVFELNQMFMQNQILKDAAESFRNNRIEKVRSLKVFPNLEISSPLFIQIIPFSFQNDQVLDLTNADTMNLQMRPLYCSGWDHMFNLDGYANFGVNRQNGSIITSYDQIFRNGIYEAYTGKIVQLYNTSTGIAINKIDGAYLVKSIVDKITDGINVLKNFKVMPPYLICLSLHQTRGAVIYDASAWSSTAIMANEIILPPLLLQSLSVNIYKSIKPHFDIIWQAGGYAKSPDFTF
jgi:hypothetical protein